MGRSDGTAYSEEPAHDNQRSVVVDRFEKRRHPFDGELLRQNNQIPRIHCLRSTAKDMALQPRVGKRITRAVYFAVTPIAQCVV